MFSPKFIICILLGMLCMFVTVFIQSRWRNVNFWKSIIVTILITITGLAGIYLMFFVETHRFGGMSFYGAVFLVPICFWFYSLFLKIKWSVLTDISAPAGCIMLVIMKIHCLVSECCEGIILHVFPNGKFIEFPSQIAEMINALILCVLLLCFAKKEKYHGKIYPLFLIIYGISRFILNCFRIEFYATKMFLPYGNIWSIVAIVIGITWLVLINRKAKGTNRERC